MDNQNNAIDFEMIKDHWLATSNDDFKTMNNLFLSGSNNWALFVGHISVEKLLKALYVQRHRQHAPRIHNLYRLAELCEIELLGDYPDWLDTVTSFNINARYDDYKKEFQRICTKEYTELWIGRIKELPASMDKADVLKITEKFTKIVQSKYDCKKIFLFGSYAQGAEHDESDIDIAVVLSEFESIVDMQTELMRLRRAIDSRIEPHPFREKDFNISNPVAFEILQYGQRID